ncbi:AMP-dependent synthetase and ligase family protein isoform 1 [Hibiscus syriacus]|uniref:AMP-dependent synthetase and ligase family protein isoform 1 n=1 Tax=Hibiscus syriacus TaxID=106335 RepID=A0A6A2XAB2_HIBSY|nr:AMP-dependent synthetase and ligase family protein isoform 1 [Hibiscus syriacus]
MGERNNGNKKAGGDKPKKENDSLTFFSKVDCLCEGCASKILKCVRELEGVETVKTERNANKVTVKGAVDPTAIKDNIAKKFKKKVDVVVPQPKKDDNKEEKKPDRDKNQASDHKQEKKPNEALLITADLKVQLKCQCQGCILKVRRIVSETKGVHELNVDTQKELVTVKGERNKEGGKNGGGSDDDINGSAGGGKKKNNECGNSGGDGGNDANGNAIADGRT